MVAIDEDEPEEGPTGASDVLDYAEAMGLQLSLLCEAVGAHRAALRFREAAAAAAVVGAGQPPEANAAPGDAA